ncbi:hypothetical protein HMPREF3036_00942 [Sutterella sp. KLE1602]|nr:hypothetical protein HMPREF3036_00942 [Sutterella sp. KLE1602]
MRFPAGRRAFLSSMRRDGCRGLKKRREFACVRLAGGAWGVTVV